MVDHYYLAVGRWGKGSPPASELRERLAVLSDLDYALVSLQRERERERERETERERERERERVIESGVPFSPILTTH